MAACLQGQGWHAGIHYRDLHQPGLSDVLLRWTDAPRRCYAINEKNMWRWGRTHFPADDILKPSSLSWIEAGIKSFSSSPAWTDGGFRARRGKAARSPRCPVPASRALPVWLDVFMKNCIGVQNLSTYCCVVFLLCSKGCLFCLSSVSLPYLKPGIILSFIKCDLVWGTMLALGINLQITQRQWSC